MTFSTTTRLPFAALTTLAPLNRRYEAAPTVELDPSQRAMLGAFAMLFPYQKYSLVRAAIEAGRFYILGCDLLALAQSAQAEEPSPSPTMQIP